MAKSDTMKRLKRILNVLSETKPTRRMATAGALPGFSFTKTRARIKQMHKERETWAKSPDLSAIVQRHIR